MGRKYRRGKGKKETRGGRGKGRGGREPIIAARSGLLYTLQVEGRSIGLHLPYKRAISRAIFRAIFIRFVSCESNPIKNALKNACCFDNGLSYWARLVPAYTAASRCIRRGLRCGGGAGSSG